MGYFIQTNKDTLIAVDGGRTSDAPLLKQYIDKYGNNDIANNLLSQVEIINHGHVIGE